MSSSKRHGFAKDLERIKFSMNAAGIGVWEVDMAAGKVIWDERCASLAGLRDEHELSYDEVSRYIHPNDMDDVRVAVAAALAGAADGLFDATYRMVGADGITRWVHFTGTAYFDEEGQVTRFGGVARDVTDIRTASQKLEQSQKDILSFFEQSPVALATIIRDSLTFTSANTFYGELVGRKTEDLIGKPLLEALPEIAGQGFDELLKDVFDSGIAYISPEVAVELVRGGRLETFYVNLAYQPVKDETGTVTSIFIVATDVSPQVVSRKKIEQSEEKLRGVIAAAPAAIGLFIGRDLVIEHPNQTFIEIVGKGPGVDGLPLREAMPELITEGQPFLKILDDVYTTGVPFISSASLVKIVQNGVLNDNYYNISYTPLRNAEGEVYGILDIAIDVTAQVKAQQALEERNRELALAMNISRLGSFKILIAAETATYSANIREWFGMNGNEAPVPELFGRIHEEDRPHVLAAVEHSVAGKKDGRHDIMYRVPDQAGGGMRHLHSVGQVIFEDGRPVSISGIIQDVTAELAGRQAVQKSEAHLQLLRDTVPAMIFYLDEEQRYTSYNRVFMEWFGVDATEALGRTVKDFIGMEAYAQIGERLAKAYSGEVVHYEITSPSRMGLTRWLHIVYSPDRLADGTVCGIVVHATDVSEARLREQQLQASETALQKAIELAELGNLSIDIDTNIITASPRMAEWLGFDNHTADIETFIRCLEENEQDHVRDSLRKAMMEGTDRRYDLVHNVINAKTGRRTILHASGQAYFDNSGRTSHMVVTAHDITAQHNLQAALEGEVQQRTEELAATVEKLRTTNEQLIRSNEELAQYAYVASHDLQEPLRKIQVFSDMLHQDGLTREKSRDLVERIGRSTARMSTLIHDLLNFSRLLNSDMEFQLTDLNETAAAVINDFELVSKDKDAVFEVGVLPCINAIGLQMNQLFYNLIGNALKFTRPGVRPHIKILSAVLTGNEVSKYIARPFHDTTYYSICIQDNGIGFEAQYAEQIFDVFKRLHGREVYPGNGIGLSLCRRIITKHHGHMYTNSVVGEGSAFCIILPAQQLQPATDGLS